MTASIHTFPTRHKKPYLVTLNKGRENFQRKVKLANSWSEVFFWAVERGDVVCGIQVLK
jgi:hypothetical protein